MPPTKRRPYRSFNFVVEVDGEIVAAFHECRGLTTDVDPVEYREGGQNLGSARARHGKPGTLVLRLGVGTTRSLWDWHQRVVEGEALPASGSVQRFDETGKPVAKWDFVAGWPSKLEGPELSAKGNEVAIEELRLSHEGLVRT
jgi:phage tail-like protein